MIQTQKQKEQTTVPTIAISIETPEFGTGFVDGLTGDDCRFEVACPVTEWGLVDIVRNLTELAQEGNLTEERLHHDCGLIVGWISRRGYQPDKGKCSA